MLGFNVSLESFISASFEFTKGAGKLGSTMLFFVVSFQVLPFPESFLAWNTVVRFCGVHGPAVNEEILNKFTVAKTVLKF